MRHLNYNGKIVNGDDPVFRLNRAINYGDGLFEGIRLLKGELLFFDDHLDRMFRAMKSLKIEVPENFTRFFFHKQIHDLLSIENKSANAKIRIGIFRSGGGLYKPEINLPEYFIEVIQMENGYQLKEVPFRVGIFEDVKKDPSTISFFKSINALPYILASIYTIENNLDDCLLLNSRGMIAEATSSNIFWIKSGEIFSPPVSDGGVEGVMRKNLILLLKENNFPFKEKSVSPVELKTVDEVFLTNVGWGIKPVTEFENVSFQTKMTSEIFTKISF